MTTPASGLRCLWLVEEVAEAVDQLTQPEAEASRPSDSSSADSVSKIGEEKIIPQKNGCPGKPGWLFLGL